MVDSEKTVRKFRQRRDRKVVIRETTRRLKVLFTPIMTLRIAILFSLIIFLSLTLGRELLTVGQGSIQSFIIVHFAGYLFFFLLPVEALIPYYYSLGYIPEILFLLAVFTAVIAQAIDYSIGRLAPNMITRNLIGEGRYFKIEKFVESYGGWLIFVFNLFPLSSSVVAVIAGVLEYPFWRWILFSGIGLIVKYAVILGILGIWF